MTSSQNMSAAALVVRTREGAEAGMKHKPPLAEPQGFGSKLQVKLIMR